MTPPSEVHLSDPAVEAATGRAHQVSAPATKKASAKKASTRLKAVDSDASGDEAETEATAKKAPAKRAAKKAPAKKAAAADGKIAAGGDSAPELEPEAVDLVVEDLELEAVVVEGDAATPKLTVDVESDEVVVTVGKKRTLDDVDESDLRAGRGGQAGGRARARTRASPCPRPTTPTSPSSR